jgi:hypothetical protein
LCFAEFAEFGQPRIFSTEGTIRIKKEEIKAIAETKTKMEQHIRIRFFGYFDFTLVAVQNLIWYLFLNYVEFNDINVHI